MEKLDTLHFIEMTKEQKELSCSIINRFGTGQHPVADESTYDGFAVDYLRELSKLIAINGKVNLDKLDKIIDLNDKFYKPKQKI